MSERLLWRVVWVLMIAGTMLLLAAPYISGRVQAQSPSELQRQIDRLRFEGDQLENRLNADRDHNDKMTLDLSTRMAALERESEIDRTGGVVAIAGNALGWWLAFARMGRFQRSAGGGGTPP